MTVQSATDLVAATHGPARVVREAGGEVRTHSEVTRVLVEDGRAVGVETADGLEHRARRAVVSTVHVKHLPRLVNAGVLGEAYLQALDRWRTGVTMFVTHYALDAAPEYLLDEGPSPSVAAAIVDSEQDMLDALAAFRRGEVRTERAPLLVISSSVADPTRAPPGRHTLKVVGFLPYELRDGGPARWDEIKEDTSRALLERYLPYTGNLSRKNILAHHVESPLDLERRNPHNYRGSCHGGDQDLAQEGALRFAYRSPLPGLYQTGSTTHPGASVTGAPGRNCAQVVLSDLDLDLGLGLGLSLKRAIEAGREVRA